MSVSYRECIDAWYMILLQRITQGGIRSFVGFSLSLKWGWGGGGTRAIHRTIGTKYTFPIVFYYQYFRSWFKLLTLQ